MKAIIAWCKRNPVRVFVAVDTFISTVVIQGLVIFDLWDPTAEQLAYATGVVGAIAAAFGISVVHNQVTPYPPPPPPEEPPDGPAAATG